MWLQMLLYLAIVSKTSESMSCGFDVVNRILVLGKLFATISNSIAKFTEVFL